MELDEVIGASYEDILDALEVSGDPEMELETIGAVNKPLAKALERGLEARKRRGEPRQREIRSGSGRGRALDTCLPMTNGDATLGAGASVNLTAGPNRDFLPEDLEIDVTDETLTITAITLGGSTLLAGSAGDIPARTFSPLNPRRPKLNWPVIPSTQQLVVTVKNNSAADKSVFGTIYGAYTML